MKEREILNVIGENLYEYRGYHIKKVNSDGEYRYRVFVPKYSEDGSVEKYTYTGIEDIKDTDFKAQQSIKDRLNRKSKIKSREDG